MPGTNDLEAEIGHVIKVLRERGDTAAVAPEVIEHTVREAFAERESARVKDFVGLFAERSARERLRNAVTQGGPRPPGDG